MDTNMVLNAGFNELVFENRHKNYGAYQIRKRYKRNVLVAGLIATSAFASMLFLTVVNSPDALAAIEIPKTDSVHITRVNMDHVVDPPKPIVKPAVNPPAKGPDNPNMSNIVITMDSVVKTPSQLDSSGTSSKGVIGGTGPVKDTTDIVYGDPFPKVDSVVVRRVDWVANPPKDPGLDDFFAKNIKYPQMAKEQGIEGVVWLSFVVNTKGDVTEIQIAKGAHPLLDKEVLRVAKFMPKWDPVMDNGEAVEFVYRKPVRFMLGK